MKLDLSDVVAHLGKRVRYEISDQPTEDPESGLAFVSPIEGEIAFSNTGRHIVARGKFRTTVELECSRCLNRYRLDLSLPVEEEFPLGANLPEGYEAEEEEEELLDEEMEPLLVDGHLDLTELLRQTVLLAVPIKTLCSEDCKGLCPRCGKNLNDGPCECPADAGEAPLAGLAELLEEELED